ncbi:MAG: pseudouridine synthase [Desulfovibrionaceae bacterium]|nr:pseudouridine synthase [Desulfovibrionaceae bacterium]
MEMEFRPRNNDFGVCVLTTQEKANTQRAGSEALAYDRPKHPLTPHVPSSTEVEQTLTQMETEAQAQNAELLRLHAGLDKERVSRLLSLLQD